MENRIVLNEELVDRFCEIIDTALKEVAYNNKNVFMNEYEDIIRKHFLKAMNNVCYHLEKKENSDVRNGFGIIRRFNFKKEDFQKSSIDLLSMDNFVSSLIKKYIHGKITSKDIVTDEDENNVLYLTMHNINDILHSLNIACDISSYEPKYGPLICRLNTPVGQFFINPDILKNLFVSYRYSIVYTGSKELIKDDIINHRLMTPLVIYYSIKSDSEFSKELSKYFELIQDFEKDPNLENESNIERLGQFMRFLNKNWMKECRNYIKDHDLSNERFWYNFNEYFSYGLLEILNNKYFEVNIKDRIMGPFVALGHITKSLEG